jgi:hypothetical protein
MKPFSPALRERLAKLMPRLASPYDGERIATLAAIERVLNAEGCDLHDLTAAVTVPAVAAPASPSPQPRQRIEARRLLTLVDLIEHEGAPLSGRARDFLADLRCRCWRYDMVLLSPRQSAWLADLAEEAGIEL